MTLLKLQDDWIHPIGEEKGWREAFYLDFFDPASGLTGFGYSGVHPNLQMGDVIFALWRGDELLARFTRWDFNIPHDIGAERLDFGPLWFRQIEPMRTWEMQFEDGFCRLALRFEAIHPPYFWADSERALAASNSHHYEQQGRYTGTIRVHGREQAIEAVGVRDHAWGWGARAGIRKWLWASAQFPDGLAFNAFNVGLGDGRDVHYGYLCRDGDNTFLRRSHLVSDYADAGRRPAGFRVALATRSGDELSADARIVNAFDISHQESNKQGYHFFCATEYVCAGATGHGHANFFWHDHASRPGDWEVSRS